ncbi:methyltransferase domain-containing protein [Dactylosporangium fulvum]|uniref:Methyltransferase domain-containing protein n=1 Tax=Dactylosporangium fulvum TaxID=53359 RepID=A0ABY5VMI2_9ACTN|nr:methyltransferase domain-containing protein [Dactylosporangium fulvum]UWP78580.1 methyltransferase domain-containing protein [Dactylosporangium fulvum]
MSIFWEFLRRPRMTGAVAASSPALARVLTDGLRLEGARTVVELGPGAGAVTGTILRRMPAGARLIAVERNGHLAERLARRYRGRPVEVIHASADRLADLVPAPVDAVVSGLPWTVMPPPVRRRILDAVGAVLAEDGGFTTFAYVHAAWTPPGRRFADDLAVRFRSVERTRVVWANLPPAFVHRAIGVRVTSRIRPIGD